MESGGWAQVAELTTPEVLHAFHQREVSNLLANAEFEATRAQTGATGFSVPDTIPLNLLSRHGGVRVNIALGSSTIAELAATSPVRFFAEWMHLATEASPFLRPAMTPRTIVGAVEEPGRAVHVLYRGGDPMEQMRVNVVPVVIRDGAWFLVLNRQIMGIASWVHFLNRRPRREPSV